MHTADIWARLHQTLPSCPTQHKRIKKFPQFKPVPRVIKNEKLPSQQLLGLCMRVCLCVCVCRAGGMFLFACFSFFTSRTFNISMCFSLALTARKPSSYLTCNPLLLFPLLGLSFLFLFCSQLITCSLWLTLNLFRRETNYIRISNISSIAGKFGE